MAASQKSKILLVEFDEFIRDALQRALEIEGFEVVAVKSAAEGINAAKKADFDVSIADYELPDGNGVEYFVLISRFCPDTVKVLMTTYGELKILADVRRYGIDDAIEKPFPFERLVRLIRFHLRQETQGKRRQAGG